MKLITENIIEESAIEILQSLGWEYANGKIKPNTTSILLQLRDMLLPKLKRG